MNPNVALWHGEHANFLRLLGLLEEQVDTFRDGGTPNYGLMRDIVFYLSHYADRFHHPRESVAFERLAQRDPGMNAPLARLQQEHRVIAASGNALLERLRDAELLDAVPRHSVEAAASTYLVYYRHHLATEDRDVLPRADELLTEEDWAAVADGVPQAPDPLFGDAADERLRELRRHIAREAAAGGAA